MIHKTELHEDVTAWEARSLTSPYRTLTCDYTLRPIGFDEVKDPYVLEGFWKQCPGAATPHLPADRRGTPGEQRGVGGA
ncbi:hypothetical protein ABZ646_43925 [Streptomyces sp. NPDC007162]|uniref:hypothetical protein n=1 Tax=Streptomyces sp. NPDC007162 TaxID=3156917 RepID=UPI0033FDD1F2